MTTDDKSLDSILAFFEKNGGTFKIEHLDTHSRVSATWQGTTKTFDVLNGEDVLASVARLIRELRNDIS